MPDPTDAELTRRVAEMIGLHVGESPPGPHGEWGHTGIWKFDGEYWDSVRFAPLAPTREGDADLGEVLRWAEQQFGGIELTFGRADEGCPHVRHYAALWRCAVDHTEGCKPNAEGWADNRARALLLALVGAGEGA